MAPWSRPVERGRSVVSAPSQSLDAPTVGQTGLVSGPDTDRAPAGLIRGFEKKFADETLSSAPIVRSSLSPPNRSTYPSG
jgi:hypothetical protein